MVQQPLLERLPSGDIPGIMACITEDFDQRAYFITGDNLLVYYIETPACQLQQEP